MKNWNRLFTVERRRVVLAAFLIGASGAALPVRAQPPARPDQRAETAREQSEAYVSLIKADRAREQLNWKEAVEGYRKALDVYRRLAAEQPAWQPDIVQYRVTYCANQIEAICTQTGKSVDELLGTTGEVAARAAADEGLREKFQALQKENQYLHQRISEMENEPVEPPPPARDAEALAALTAEKEGLGRRVEELQKELTSKSDVDAAHHEQVVLENDRMTSELAALRREADDARKALESLRPDAERAAALEAENDSLQERLSASDVAGRAAEVKRENEIGRLKGRLEKAAGEKDNLENVLQEQRRLAASESERIKQAEAALAALREEMPRWQADADAAHAEAERLKKEKDELGEKLKDEGRQSEKLARAAEKEAARAAEMQAARQELAAQLDARSGEVAALQQQVTDLARAREDAEALRQDLAVRAREIESLEKEVGASAYLRVEKKELEQALEKSRKELDALRAKEIIATPAPEGSAGAAPAEGGLDLEKSGRYREAIGAYARELETNPDSADLSRGLGRCHLKLGEAAAAIEIFERLTAANPEDKDSRLLLGVAYCADLHFDRAVESLQQVVNTDPRNASARSALGAAWMGLGTLDSARQELEEATRINPALGDAHYNLAQVLCFSSPPDLKKARKHYDKALKLGAASNPELEKLLSP